MNMIEILYAMQSRIYTFSQTVWISLPFGAVGTVGGFSLVSMSVWFLGLTGMGLAWTTYFDDYTLFSSDIHSF